MYPVSAAVGRCEQLHVTVDDLCVWGGGGGGRGGGGGCACICEIRSSGMLIVICYSTIDLHMYKGTRY